MSDKKIQGTDFTLDDLKKTLNEHLSGIGDKWEEDRRKHLEAQSQSQPPQPPPAPTQEPSVELPAKTAFGRYCRYALMARSAAGGFDIATKAGDKAVLGMFEKAQGIDSLTTGGAMVAPNYVDDLIPLLVSESVFQRAGPEEVDMPGGTYVQPYEDTGPTVSSAGESEAVNETSITYGEISMTAKKLVAYTTISEEMMMDVRNADMKVQNTLLRKLGETMDNLIFNGSGVSNEPVGLKLQITGASNNFAADAVISLNTVNDDLKTLIGKAEDADIPVNKPTFFMSHRSKRYLAFLLTSNGQKVFPEMSTGKLIDAPFFATNQIPNTGGAGSDESEVYHLNVGNILLGTTGPVAVDIVPYATYLNSSGTMVSGFSRGEHGIRVAMRWDMIDKFRGKSGGVATGVKWA